MMVEAAVSCWWKQPMAGTKIIGNVLGAMELPVSAEEPMPDPGATPDELVRNSNWRFRVQQPLVRGITRH